MKKFLSLILVLSMVLMLFSCNEKQVAQNETTKVENVAGDAANTAEEDFSNYVIKSGRLTRNTVESENMRAKIKDFGININTEILYYDDLNTGLLALDRKDIDYFITNASTIKYIMNQNFGKYSMLNFPEKSYEEYSMGALEKNKDIIDKIDGAIKELGDTDELWNIKLKNMEITNDSNKSKMPHFDGTQTYRVILTGDLPPMDYVNTSGEPIGFNVDLLTAIANKLKVNFEIVTSNAASRFLMLTSDKADIAFWTLKVSSLGKDATTREALEVSVNNDNSKLKEFMNDVPQGIVTTRPYMIDQQACLFLKGSKFERYLKLDKKETMPKSNLKYNVADHTLPLFGNFKEIELTDEDKKNGITAKYNREDETLCEVFSYDNKEKLRLEDFVNKARKEHGGCIEDKTEEMGRKCLLNTFSMNKDGEIYIIHNYYIEDGDKIVGHRYIRSTKEVRLGNSDYYMNIPVKYGDAEDNNQKATIEDAEINKYTSPDERFYPTISIKRWDENKCSYSDMKLRLKKHNNNCDVTETFYNKLAKGGWTLDKYYDLQLKRYNDGVIDKLKGKNDFEINYIIVENLNVDNDGITDEAVITIADNEKFINIILQQPQKYWRAYGEAIAQTIHKK